MASGSPVCNFRSVTNAAGEIERHYIPVTQLTRNIRRYCGGWPRVVSGMLFVAKDPDQTKVPDRDAVSYITSSEELKAWLGRKFAREWTHSDLIDPSTNRKVKAVTWQDLFYMMRDEPEQRYEAIEQLPHHRPLAGVYYLNRKLPEPTGESLSEFMQHLNPETEQDRELLKAMLLTLFAGLNPGNRPGFVLTSRYGKGVGKTQTAEAFADIVGGSLVTQPNEDEDRRLQRLLSSDSLWKRVVLIDNVKGRTDSASIESLITADRIQGHRLYAGQATRLNLLTWIFTSNSPEVSSDLAERVVIINLGKQRVGVDFRGWVQNFLWTKRLSLIADVLAELRRGGGEVIEEANRDRFGEWQQVVLSKCSGANELARLIKRRREEVDADAEQAAMVYEALVVLLKKSGYERPERERLMIPWKFVHWALKGLWDDGPSSLRKISYSLRPLLGTGRLRGVRLNTNRRYGRGIVWTGDEAEDITTSTIQMFAAPHDLMHD